MHQFQKIKMNPYFVLVCHIKALRSIATECGISASETKKEPHTKRVGPEVWGCLSLYFHKFHSILLIISLFMLLFHLSFTSGFSFGYCVFPPQLPLLSFTSCLHPVCLFSPLS